MHELFALAENGKIIAVYSDKDKAIEDKFAKDYTSHYEVFKLAGIYLEDIW